jgi:hypothetical protein
MWLGKRESSKDWKPFSRWLAVFITGIVLIQATVHGSAHAKLNELLIALRETRNDLVIVSAGLNLARNDRPFAASVLKRKTDRFSF